MIALNYNLKLHGSLSDPSGNSLILLRDVFLRECQRDIGVLVLEQESVCFTGENVYFVTFAKCIFIKIQISMHLKSEIKSDACLGIKMPVLQIIGPVHYNFAAKVVEHFRECRFESPL